MIKKIITIALILGYFSPAIGQESPKKKIKEFNAWVKLNDDRRTMKGLLYSIGDSSIFLVKSVNDVDIQDYNFRNIEMLKIQKKKSILTWGLIGSAIGTAGGLIASTSLLGDIEYLTGPIYSAMGLYFGLLGGGAGVLMGVIKDRYPVRHRYKNFDKYRGTLQDYSYLIEKNSNLPKFEHRFYGGFNVGFSHAYGEFTDSVPLTDYKGMSDKGYGARFFVGYRFTKNVGVSISMLNSMFPVKDKLSSQYWGYDSFMASPEFTFPVSDKFRFNIIPRIGYATAYLMGEDEELLNGNGFGVNLSGSVIYNFSKRWYLSLETGYNSSGQKFENGCRGKARSFDTQIGLAYKWGKHSL